MVYLIFRPKEKPNRNHELQRAYQKNVEDSIDSVINQFLFSFFWTISFILSENFSAIWKIFELYTLTKNKIVT